MQTGTLDLDIAADPVLKAELDSLGNSPQDDRLDAQAGATLDGLLQAAGSEGSNISVPDDSLTDAILGNTADTICGLLVRGFVFADWMLLTKFQNEIISGKQIKEMQDRIGATMEVLYLISLPVKEAVALNCLTPEQFKVRVMEFAATIPLTSLEGLILDVLERLNKATETRVSGRAPKIDMPRGGKRQEGND